MKHHHHSLHQDQRQHQHEQPASALPPAAGEKATQNELDFVPSPDEVARKAYFTFVNQGSRQGHEVEHCLEAEAQLVAERNLTRVHGFHNRT